MPPILKLTEVAHRYRNRNGGIPVLEGIELAANRGELIGIFGDSGSGKTTLLLACGGMLKPTRGKVILDGDSIFEMSAPIRSGFRAAKIGFLFQTLELIPYLSLIDNVRLARNVSRERAKELLEHVGLGDRLTHQPQALSHGQRQRGALARAMAHRPALILADEPTGNLDARNRQVVLSSLRQFADDGGTVIVASHDSNLRSISDQCWQLDSGKLTRDP